MAFVWRHFTIGSCCQITPQLVWSNISWSMKQRNLPCCIPWSAFIQIQAQWYKSLVIWHLSLTTDWPTHSLMHCYCWESPILISQQNLFIEMYSDWHSISWAEVTLSGWYWISRQASSSSGFSSAHLRIPIWEKISLISRPSSFTFSFNLHSISLSDFCLA